MIDYDPPIESQPKTTSLVSRRLIFVVLGTFATALIVVVAIFVCAVRTAFTEKNISFPAIVHAPQATLAEIQQGERSWPISWDDLAPFRAASDFDWVAELARFNFEADSRRFDTEPQETFLKFGPIQPCRSPIDDEVQHLIEALRDTWHETDENGTTR